MTSRLRLAPAAQVMPEDILLVAHDQRAAPAPKGASAVLHLDLFAPGGGLIGPFVRPDQPGCRTCFLLRRAAAVGGLPDLASVSRAAAAAALPALDAALSLGPLPPYPAVLSWGPRGIAAAHRLLPRPDCPECGGGWIGGTFPAFPEDLVDPLLGPLATGRLIASGGSPDVVAVASASTRNSFLRPGAECQYAWGRGMNACEAELGARFEALENYGAVLWNRRQFAPAGLPSAEELGWRVLRFGEDGTVGPLRVDRSAPHMSAAANGRALAVPAVAVVCDAHPSLLVSQCGASRSGVGAGRDPTSAARIATQEAVERWTLARYWGAGACGRPLARENLPAELLRGLTDASLTADLALLGAGVPYVVVARIRSQRPPFETMGAAARAAPQAAAFAAVSEALQMRTGLRASLTDPDTYARFSEFLAGRNSVDSIYDRALFVAAGRHSYSRDRLLGLLSNEEHREIAAPQCCGVALVDLTTPDVRASGLCVMRALILVGAMEDDELGMRFAEPFPIA